MRSDDVLRAPPGTHGFICHGLTASAEGGLLSPDDVLSTQEPAPCRWFRDEVRAFFVAKAMARRPPGDKDGAVSATELADVFRELESSDTCVLTAQVLLAEYTKWRDQPGGLQDYWDEPVDDYMVKRSQRKRAPQDPTQYTGTLLRFISQDSVSGFIFSRLQRKKYVNVVLRIGLPQLVDFLEAPLSTRDGVLRYGLLLISRPGHVHVIERRGMHCCIMQSSTNSYHLANFLLQVRPLTEHMKDDAFFDVFRRSAETYSRLMPCEELLEHYRALLPSRGDTAEDRAQRLERLALLGGEPWSKVGLRPEEYLEFYQELVSFAPFHVAWPAPQSPPCVAW